ncbi:type I 3-dehydroquinate dehydratase, partial [Fructobacillus ficulneus]
MKTVTVQNLTLTPGTSKIAVPLTGANLAELKDQVALVDPSQVDLIEWRLDFLNPWPDSEELADLAQGLWADLPGLPIIATFRTQAEGGQRALSNADYQDLLLNLCQLPVDIIDLEINHDKDLVDQVIATAHTNGKKIIASFHNFQETPANDDLTVTFRNMADAQADIAKIAVMPQTEADVLRLMTVSQASQANLPIPVVSMAMGPLGQLSRIAGS